MSYGAPQPERGQRRGGSGGFSDRRQTPRDLEPIPVRDRLREAVQKIQGYSADVRKEAHLLRTPNFNAARGKSKVQSAMETAAAIREEAEKLLMDFGVSGSGLSREEQHHRKATHDKLSDDLQASWKILLDASKEYNDAAIRQELNREVEEERNKLANEQQAVRRAAQSLRHATEEYRSEAVRLQATAQELDVSSSEVTQHSGLVQEFAGEVQAIGEDIQTLSNCMVSLADLTQQQGEQLDNIESHMSIGAQSTGAATEQLIQTARAVHFRTKWQCWVLLIAIVLSTVLVIIIATKK
mmetsp:Transcript_142867/g.252240  ORF Transcript_142867/g.252240 Transcript_142867/m.252240 type:complete len:297 (-) Transcript_142867:95-985(-)